MKFIKKLFCVCLIILLLPILSGCGSNQFSKSASVEKTNFAPSDAHEYAAFSSNNIITSNLKSYRFTYTYNLATDEKNVTSTTINAIIKLENKDTIKEAAILIIENSENYTIYIKDGLAYIAGKLKGTSVKKRVKISNNEYENLGIDLLLSLNAQELYDMFSEFYSAAGMNVEKFTQDQTTRFKINAQNTYFAYNSTRLGAGLNDLEAYIEFNDKSLNGAEFIMKGTNVVYGKNTTTNVTVAISPFDGEIKYPKLGDYSYSTLSDMIAS